MESREGLFPARVGAGSATRLAGAASVARTREHTRAARVSHVFLVDPREPRTNNRDRP